MSAEPERRRLRVPPTGAGERLDKLLAREMASLSRAYLRELIDAEQVRVEGRPRRARYRVAAGQEIEVLLVARRLLRPGGELPLPELGILFEDEDLLVVDKAAGVAVHPGGGRLSGTISQAAAARYGFALPSSGPEDRPGIVHRLDVGTTGVLVLAKTERALLGLQREFKERRVRKEYRAIVAGEPRFESDWVTSPIGRDPRRPELRRVAPEGGREAESYWEVEERFRGFALLRVLPKTGRTHQIRVHLTSIGHAILGDRAYRARAAKGASLPGAAPLPDRPCLHALRLAFCHPSSGSEVEFEAPIPRDMEALLAWLRRERARSRDA